MEQLDQAVQQLPEPVQQMLDSQFLGNNLVTWGIAAAVFAAVWLLLRLLKPFLRKRLERLAERTDNRVDDLLATLVESTRGFFLLVVALYAGSLPLELGDAIEGGLHKVLFIALLIQAGLWADKVIDHLLERYLSRADEAAGEEGAEEEAEEDAAPRLAVLSLFSFFSRVAVWSMVLLLSIDNLGYDVTALIAGLGIGGIAVGLALQNVLQDTFASLSIILDRPFEIGDFIVVGDFQGTVEKIGIKTTRLRSLSGEQLIFGNSDLLSSRIRNCKRMQERRGVFTFGVVYDTPPEKLEAIPKMVREIIEKQENTRFERAHFKSYGASSLDFEVVYHLLVPDYAVFMDVQQEINLALYRRFAEESIDFAYPTRTVILTGGVANGGVASEDSTARPF
jgi:small-conductance mechanosensitive channel